MNHQEENNERTSAIATGIITGLFLALCFLVSCWKAPGPPWPEQQTGMTLSLGNIAGTTETGSPQEQSSSQETPQETNADIQGHDVESDVEVPDSDPSDEVPSDLNPTESDPTNDQVSENPTDVNPTEENPSQSNPTEDPPLYEDEGDAKGDPTGKPEGNPEGTTELYNPDGNPGEGTGGGGGGESGLVMDSWAWKDKPDTRAVKHTGTIKARITVDDEGNITNITFIGDYGAFDVDDREAIKAAIKRSGVKAKNLSSIPPESEQGIATFIIKR